MRPEVELLAKDATGRPVPTAFLGRRWALGLGTGLLVGLAVITLARWQERASAHGAGPETVIQQPVPPEPFPAARSDTTAPDPGDNPP